MHGNGAGGGSGAEATSSSGGSSSASSGGDTASAGASGGVSAGAGNGVSGGSSGTNSGSPPGPFAIASALRSSCALDGQGLIHCWGEVPGVWSIPTGPFMEIHASIDAFCAVRADHSFTCFDAPVVGAAPSGVQDRLPTGKVEAITMDRGCICWTDDSGHSACNSPFREQSMVPTGTTFSQFEVGFNHACGISASDGTVQCWGFAGDESCAVKVPAAGQLVAPSGTFVSISGANYSACVLDKNGVPTCWGAGKAGDDPSQILCGYQLNFGQAAPPAGVTFRSIAMSDNHSCGVKTDGTLACWGAGTADADCPDTGVDCRQSRPPSGVFAQVSLGGLFSCAMNDARKVQCWGYQGTGDGRLDVPAIFQ